MSHRAVNYTWRLLSFALQTRAVAFTLMLSQQVNAKDQSARGERQSPDLEALSSGPLCTRFLGTSAAMTRVSLEPSHTLSKVTGSGFGMSEILLW